MRRVWMVPMCVVAFAALTMAQNKIETKWHCSKATEQHKLDVGDMPGHTYGIQQGTCTATSTDPSFQEKSGTFTEFDEMGKATYTGHGRYNVTMDNGDMVYYTYTTSGSADTKKPASNKWTIHTGTGKEKGIKGSGTCSGTRNDDGSSDWECTGTNTMAAK